MKHEHQASSCLKKEFGNEDDFIVLWVSRKLGKKRKNSQKKIPQYVL